MLPHVACVYVRACRPVVDGMASRTARVPLLTSYAAGALDTYTAYYTYISGS